MTDFPLLHCRTSQEEMTLDERLPSPHRPMETDDAYWISLYADYVTGNRLVLLDCCSAAATRLLRFEERRRLSREPLASASDDELAVAIAGDSHVDLVNEQILPPVVDAQLSEPLSDKDLPLSAYPERVVLSYDPSSSPPPAATETGNTRQPEEERSILALYDFPESQQIEVHYDNEVSPLDEIPLLAAIPEEVEEDPLLPLPQQENEEPASQVWMTL